MATGVFGGDCVEKHTAYIFDRGGSTRILQLIDASQIRWERDRDGVSEATVRVEGSACSAQADALASIEPKRHELVIFRGQDRVWEGPIWRVGWHSDYVEVNAHDVFQYLLGTPLSQTYDNRYRDDYTVDPPVAITRPTWVTARVEEIIEHELLVWEALDPPVNLLPHLSVQRHDDTDPRTTAYTRPYEMTVGEHIQNLARVSGIDWTCVGRAIHIWDVDRHLGRTRVVTEADFIGSEVIITAYGADHAQHAYVVGEEAIYGEAHATEYGDYYGPWTTIFTAYNEEGTTAPTQAELDSQAQRNLSGRQPVPVEVRVPDNSSIRLSDTLTINDLVPGVQVPVLATLNARRTSQMQKVDHVTVIETSSGETIQVTLAPASSGAFTDE